MIDRFEEKFIPEPNSGCWIWTGSMDKNSGYGKFAVNRAPKGAHRVSVFLYKCEDIEEKVVMHSCDTKLCVNPDHLQIGTHLENARDARKRGLSNNPFGCRVSTSKLDEETVMKILYDKRKRSEISEEYNISKSMVTRIKRGLSWSKITKVNYNPGKRCNKSKLTKEQISKILSDDRSQKEISIDYNVSQSYISSIKSIS